MFLEDIRHIICLYEFYPKNTDQSKIKQPHEIAEITTVTSVQAPKTLQPGKCPFHHPAANGIPVVFPCFFPSAVDMPLTSINIDFFADLWIIISLVQTEMANQPSETRRPVYRNSSGAFRSGGYYRRWLLLTLLPGECPGHPHANGFCCVSSSVSRITLKTFSR